MNIQIIELSQKPEMLDKAVHYFWKCWGSESNFIFYKDCIIHSLEADNPLPKFYIVVDGTDIIASYALLTNDIISRQDLMPWLACLHVNKAYRNRGIAAQLLNHGLAQAQQKGFEDLHLSSDLINFYERKGWTYLCEGYGVSGGNIKIYKKETK